MTKQSVIDSVVGLIAHALRVFGRDFGGPRAHSGRRRATSVVAVTAAALGLLVAVPGAAQAATFTVTTTADSGPGSLRQAIIDANGSAGADVIRFEPEALGPPPYTITLTSAENLSQVLPPIYGEVTIDATTLPGWTPSTPRVQILSGGPFGGASVFTVLGEDVTIRGVSIAGDGDNAFGSGIDVAASVGNVTIEYNQFGVDLAGSELSGPQMNNGVLLRNSGFTGLPSTRLVAHNLFANAASGVAVLPGGRPTTIEHNTLGLSRNESPLFLNTGIELIDVGYVTVNDNVIVGDISTNSGISLTNSATSPWPINGNDVLIENNRIGSSPNGDVFPGRGAGGIFLSAPPSGSLPLMAVTGNIIVGGSGNGITLSGGGTACIYAEVSGNTIQGNVGSGIRATAAGCGGWPKLAGNSISRNGELGIDTLQDGQNPARPVITSATPGSDLLGLDFSSETMAAGNADVSLSFNSTCEADTEGETPQAINGTIALDAQGSFSGQIDTGYTFTDGQNLTVLVTPGNDFGTSEYSDCYRVGGDEAISDLVVQSVSTSSPAVSTGSSFEVTAVVKNQGPSDATNIDIGFFELAGEGSLPAGTTFVGGSLTTDSGTVDCEPVVAGGVSCPIGFLPSQATATASIILQTSASTPPIINIAAVAASATFDNDGSNNILAADPVSVSNQPPTVEPASATVDQGGSVDITLSGSDLDGNPLVFLAPQPPAHGTLTGIDDGIADCDQFTTACTIVVTYTPDPGYFGPDSFTVTTNDGYATSDAAIVSIDVQPPSTYDLTVNKDGTGQGSVTSNETPPLIPGIDCGTDCTQTYPSGAEVTLTVTANTGSTFTGWTGGSCSGTDPCTVTMDQARTITATFTQITYDLTVNKDGTGQGSVTSNETPPVIPGIDCGDDCEETYLSDTVVTLTATADAGSIFTGWDGSVCEGTGPCTVTMVQARTITATFTQSATAADLGITEFIATPDPVTRGLNVAYVATVRNSGPSTAEGTSFTLGNSALDGLPAGTSFVSGTATSTLGGSGTCTQAGSGPVECTLGATIVPFDSATWTVTVVLNVGSTAPASLPVFAEVRSTTPDPDNANNRANLTTTVDEVNPDKTAAYVPPSTQTQTVATSPTVLLGGQVVPVATPGDTTAAAVAVPPGGPGGVVTIDEQSCAAPFCTPTTDRQMTTTPASAPINEKVVQFVPPTSPYYDYRHPLTYTIAYDKTTVVGVRPLQVRIFYTKDTSPETLRRAQWCPLIPRSRTPFPCVRSVRVVKSSNAAVNGDLIVRMLATYNDPKIGTYR